jgi:hypothetical protein
MSQGSGASAAVVASLVVVSINRRRDNARQPLEPIIVHLLSHTLVQLMAASRFTVITLVELTSVMPSV